MTEEERKPISAIKKNRSTSYPRENLKKSVEDAGIIRKQIGTSEFSRESGSIALGYSGISGASSTKIATMVHFGLLSRQANVYKISHLAERILIPVSDEDYKKALIEAVKKPNLYKALIEKYSNSSIPGMLANLLVHDYKIQENVSRNAVLDFTRSLEFAGLLTNGVLKAQVDPPVTKEELTDDIKTEAPLESQIHKEYSTKNSELYSVPLPSGIVILFPREVTYNVVTGHFAKGIAELENSMTSIAPQKETTQFEEE